MSTPCSWAVGGANRLADEIDRSIAAHVSAILNQASLSSTPRILISHRHKDVEVARGLTDLLRAAFKIDAGDVRCTSVQPYRLPFGRNTSERLRDEIKGAEAVLGILAPDTAESTYVMFELGAAWAHRTYTVPLLSRGAGIDHIPGPIFDLAPGRIWIEPDCHQLITDLANELSLERRANVDAEVSERIKRLAVLASPAE